MGRSLLGSRFVTVRRVFTMTLAVLLASATQAQQAQMQAVAKMQQSAIEKSKQKTAVVMDFEGPDEFVTPLGQQMADELSGDLAQLASKFSLIDRAQLSNEVEKNGLARSALRYPDIASAISEQLKAKLAIVGTLARDSDSGSLKATVDIYRLDSGADLQRLTVLIPVTNSINQQLTPIEHINMKDDTIPSAPADGISPVVCIQCPSAQFTQAATDHKYSGMVLLTAVIGTDGVATEIYPIKPADYGLTWSAVHTVRSWKFKPATRPNGDRVKVRQKIEVVFHLY